MKFSLHIDPEREEELILYLREHRPVADEITRLLQEREGEETLWGTCGERTRKLPPDGVEAIFVEDGRVWALFEGQTWRLPERLYRYEEVYASRFVKIHQSCIVNPAAVVRFESSLGTLSVVLKSGRREYVARRRINEIKERFGLKK